MYIVLYSFQVKPNKEKEFIKGWKELTKLIFEFEGSLGSRLHVKSLLNYIAYAQWPDKKTFETSGNRLPAEAEVYRNLMHESCEKIEAIGKMEVIEDLLA